MRKIQVLRTEHGLAITQLNDGKFTQGEKVNFVEENPNWPQLTVLDIFAAEVMSGLMTERYNKDFLDEVASNEFIDKLADRAYLFAEAMMKQKVRHEQTTGTSGG